MSTLVHHPAYYFPNGTHIFRVENTLYRLHDNVLVAHSGLFKDMFTIGDAGYCFRAEGRNDAQPIFLEGERQAIFDLFLDHINGRSHGVGSDHTYSQEQLRDLLQFVDKYRCPIMRLFVIDHIWEARLTYHPIELMQLGCQFKIPKLFECGFKFLLDTPLKQITKQHRQEMGSEVFITLVYAKSVLEEHVRIVACEEPAVLTHADDCQDSIACQEDWHAVWWNGMGRLLLDGRNPQSFTAAVEHFREMQFGRMGIGYQELMFQVLERGVAFQHTDVFIADICSGLVDRFRLTDL